MNLAEVIKFIGHSHKNRRVNKGLKEIGFDTIPDPENLHEGVPFYVTHKHSDQDISLIFNGYKYFLAEFGSPIGYTEKQENELILMWVTLRRTSLGTFPKELVLPFNFSLEQSKEEIIDTLKKDSVKVKKYPDDDTVSFKSEAIQFILGFDDNNKMSTIIIAPLSKEDQKVIDIEANLQSQVENILVKNVEQVNGYANPIPNLDWSYQSTLGSNKAKEIVSRIYVELQTNLSELTNRKDPKGIYYAIRTAVVELNNAQKIGLQIDTDERELLCVTMLGLLSATGFESKNSDVTIKWRNW